jgi:hypothetical protein
MIDLTLKKLLMFMKFRLSFLMIIFILSGIFLLDKPVLSLESAISALSTTTTLKFTTTTQLDLQKMIDESNKLQLLTTTEDLKKAGFTSVTEIKTLPEMKRFELPVQYFNVGEKIPESDMQNDCSDCGQLVSVYVTPVVTSTTLPLWAIKNNPSASKIAGRIQIKIFVAGQIAYITSPNENLGLKLANILRERIILNQTLLPDKTNQ